MTMHILLQISTTAGRTNPVRMVAPARTRRLTSTSVAVRKGSPVWTARWWTTLAWRRLAPTEESARKPAEHSTVRAHPAGQDPHVKPVSHRPIYPGYGSQAGSWRVFTALSRTVLRRLSKTVGNFVFLRFGATRNILLDCSARAWESSVCTYVCVVCILSGGGDECRLIPVCPLCLAFTKSRLSINCRSLQRTGVDRPPICSSDDWIVYGLAMVGSELPFPSGIRFFFRTIFTNRQNTRKGNIWSQTIFCSLLQINSCRYLFSIGPIILLVNLGKKFNF